MRSYSSCKWLLVGNFMGLNQNMPCLGMFKKIAEVASSSFVWTGDTWGKRIIIVLNKFLIFPNSLGIETHLINL